MLCAKRFNSGFALRTTSTCLEGNLSLAGPTATTATERGTLAAVAFTPMLTTASITAETFSAALLGLEDLSLRLTAAALHVAANPEKHPRLRLMLADLSEVMQACEEDLGWP